MYRFKKEFQDAEIHIASKRLKINRFNLSDEYAELILRKFPQFAHNIELVEDKEEDKEEVKAVTKTPAKKSTRRTSKK